jgi:hypothetical protein
MVVVKNEINDDKQYMSNAGHFEGHACTVVQFGVHCPMEHISGFMQSHYMPPSGKCPRSIALAAAMVNDFEKKKNTNLTQLLPSVFMVDRQKKAIES